MAAVRVVPAALPHLPAFSGVTSLKYCVNSGRVSSLTLPSHLSFPKTGNACPAAPDGTTKRAAATTAATAPPVRRVRCIAPSPPQLADANGDRVLSYALDRQTKRNTAHEAVSSA